jgi:hypothetical protein
VLACLIVRLRWTSATRSFTASGWRRSPTSPRSECSPSTLNAQEERQAKQKNTSFVFVFVFVCICVCDCICVLISFVFSDLFLPGCVPRAQARSRDYDCLLRDAARGGCALYSQHLHGQRMLQHYRSRGRLLSCLSLALDLLLISFKGVLFLERIGDAFCFSSLCDQRRPGRADGLQHQQLRSALSHSSRGSPQAPELSVFGPHQKRAQQSNEQKPRNQLHLCVFCNCCCCFKGARRHLLQQGAANLSVCVFVCFFSLLLLQAYGTRESHETTLDGRVAFDVMQLLQRDYKLRS